MDVEMRHLRALVTLREELNFTRAAERLYLTQQALSAQIRQLEARVGAQLVERDSRRVALTPAGEALCAHAEPLLAGAERAVRAARAAERTAPSLTVGYVAPLTRRLVGPAFEQFAEVWPDVEIIIHFAGFLDPLAGLREGAADVGILYGDFAHDGIELRPLFSEPRGVALAANHPLATRDAITMDEFLAEPLVEVPVRDQRWSDFWTGMAYRGGRAPRIGASVSTLDGLMEAVGAGLGVVVSVAPVVEAVGRAADVVFRPLAGLSPLQFWVARRELDDRAHVVAFCEAAAVALGPN